MPNKRLPSKFYFRSQYSAPFHRNVDRLGAIDIRTFDPYDPKSRQTVANCKKHRRQRHDLSDKCKHVLAIVDAQERLLSTRPEALQSAGYSAQGAQMQAPEISIEFGDGVPEIAKEYVKFWIEQSGMVKEPFSRQYDVHDIKDEHNHSEKPSIVLMVPYEETDITDEKQMLNLIKIFFQHPKEFANKFKIGNIRIYSTNKKTHEEDAVGYLNHLPVKIIGQEIITKNLQKATVSKDKYIDYMNDQYNDIITEYRTIIGDGIRLKDKMKEKKNAIENEKDPDKIKTMQDEYEKMSMRHSDRYEKIRNLGSRASSHYEKINQIKGSPIIDAQKKKIADMQRTLKAEESIEEKAKKDKEHTDKQKNIIGDMLSLENNIAENRMGEGTNPIGYAMQVAETPVKAINNLISGAVNVVLAQKERKIEEEKQRKLDQIAMEESKLVSVNNYKDENKLYDIPDDTPIFRDIPKGGVGNSSTVPPGDAGGGPTPSSGVVSTGTDVFGQEEISKEPAKEPIESPPVNRNDVEVSSLIPNDNARTKKLNEEKAKKAKVKKPKVKRAVIEGRRDNTGKLVNRPGEEDPNRRKTNEEIIYQKRSGDLDVPIFGKSSKNASQKYLNTSDLIIIAKLKRRGI